MEEVQEQLAELEQEHDAQRQELSSVRGQLQQRQQEHDSLAQLTPDAVIADPAPFFALARQCGQRMRQLQASLGQLLTGSPSAGHLPAGPWGMSGSAQQSMMSVAVGKKALGPGEAEALDLLMQDFFAVVSKLGNAAQQLQAAAPGTPLSPGASGAAAAAAAAGAAAGSSTPRSPSERGAEPSTPLSPSLSTPTAAK
jgi:hypothetical protein